MDSSSNESARRIRLEEGLPVGTEPEAESVERVVTDVASAGATRESRREGEPDATATLCHHGWILRQGSKWPSVKAASSPGGPCLGRGARTAGAAARAAVAAQLRENRPVRIRLRRYAEARTRSTRLCSAGLLLRCAAALLESLTSHTVCDMHAMPMCKRPSEGPKEQGATSMAS